MLTSNLGVQTISTDSTLPSSILSTLLANNTGYIQVANSLLVALGQNQSSAVESAIKGIVNNSTGNTTYPSTPVNSTVSLLFLYSNLWKLSFITSKSISISYHRNNTIQNRVSIKEEIKDLFPICKRVFFNFVDHLAKYLYACIWVMSSSLISKEEKGSLYTAWQSILREWDMPTSWLGNCSRQNLFKPSFYFFQGQDLVWKAMLYCLSKIAIKFFIDRALKCAGEFGIGPSNCDKYDNSKELHSHYKLSGSRQSRECLPSQWRIYCWITRRTHTMCSKRVFLVKRYLRKYRIFPEYRHRKSSSMWLFLSATLLSLIIIEKEGSNFWTYLSTITKR